MKRIPKKDLEEIRKLDLLSYYLNYEPEALIKDSRKQYRLKDNHSLVLSNGYWNDFNGEGGKSALDYFIKVEGKDFLEVAHYLNNLIKTSPPIVKEYKKKNMPFRLPIRYENNNQVFNYLTKQRKIDREIVNYCFENKLLYEDEHHNAVFLGYDSNNICRYGFKRATIGKDKFDIAGSRKEYNFKITNKNSTTLHVFESAIDLLSYITLQKLDHQDYLKDNYLALGGATGSVPPALSTYLNIHYASDIILHLDNDSAGKICSSKIKEDLSNFYKIKDECNPNFKDVNEQLIHHFRNRHNLER